MPNSDFQPFTPVPIKYAISSLPYGHEEARYFTLWVERIAATDRWTVNTGGGLPSFADAAGRWELRGDDYEQWAARFGHSFDDAVKLAQRLLREDPHLAPPPPVRTPPPMTDAELTALTFGVFTKAFDAEVAADGAVVVPVGKPHALPAAEQWQAGDVVLDAKSALWCRARPEHVTQGWPWGYSGGQAPRPGDHVPTGAVEEHVPVRPLTLLVRDGQLVNAAAATPTAVDQAAVAEPWAADEWLRPDSDLTDPRYEFSPVLGARVECLLGEPWYLEASSPGGDYVTWLDLPDGSRVGVSPHPALDRVMRWYMALDNGDGDPVVIEHELRIDTPPETVAERVKQFVATNVPGARLDEDGRLVIPGQDDNTEGGTR